MKVNALHTGAGLLSMTNGRNRQPRISRDSFRS